MRIITPSKFHHVKDEKLNGECCIECWYPGLEKEMSKQFKDAHKDKQVSNTVTHNTEKNICMSKDEKSVSLHSPGSHVAKERWKKKYREKIQLIRSTYCSCRIPRFGSQHLHGISQPSVPRDLASLGTRHCTKCINTLRQKTQNLKGKYKTKLHLQLGVAEDAPTSATERLR